MTERIRTALVGCGKVGQIHAAALGQLPESEFVAVCDRNSGSLRAAMKGFGVTAAFRTGTPASRG